MSEKPAPAAQAVAFVAVALFGFVVIELGPAFDAVHAAAARALAVAGWVGRVAAVVAVLIAAVAVGGPGGEPVAHNVPAQVA